MRRDDDDVARRGLTAARALVRPGVLTVGLLGAGPLAAAYCALLPRLLPTVSQICLYDPDERAANALWDRLVVPLRRHGVDLDLGRTTRDAVRGADLVLPVDARRTAAVRPGWLAAGAVLVNIGPPLRRASHYLVVDVTG